ncbi:DUF2793 domain-containing protein [Mesorhizobium sp. YM1C-6-2]|uniref:DUF2793 domain-containing protein n=1 Tax=Mesorhizobium sp. YM1C-6-2 TaxID=1827501 RepID=UPI000EF22917|nr:DUF2793 domain-containing protein [Mesorhizobium sp. YM1C-6-2]RLP25218.1 DUF2793 domain-containing protein [Mesorhizobium sp. YM1C-6-2]
MENSANLQLPYIMPSQAQKHVTHNEAVRTLDALVQLAVLDRDLPTPPATPVDGARYLIAAVGTDAWAGKDGTIAAWQDGAWAFLAPKAGWVVWVADEDRLLGFDGAAWIDAAVHSVNPAPLVGVNTAADPANRLAVKSPASLFDEEDGDHRLKINKAAAGDTASLVFQSGYSGRAEFGLAGDDDWHVKVSANGTAWTEALKVDRATGRVSLPAALPLGDENQIVTRRHVRETLTGNRTYHVRADGSDGNAGLADSAAGAFLTLQKAFDTICTIDLNGHTVTISVGSGSFEGITFNKAWVGGNIVVSGAGASNTVIASTSSGAAFHATAPMPGIVTLQNMKITNSAGGGIRLDAASRFLCGAGLEFGTCVASHILAAAPGAFLSMLSAYTISGGSIYHLNAQFGAYIRATGVTVTLTGTPAFSIAYANASNMGAILASGSFSGAATGPRYTATAGGGINTSGSGASFFPGNASGTATSPGWYL